MLCELKGESQSTGVLKTERNLPDKGKKVGGREGGGLLWRGPYFRKPGAREKM